MQTWVFVFSWVPNKNRGWENCVGSSSLPLPCHLSSPWGDQWRTVIWGVDVPNLHLLSAHRSRFFFSNGWQLCTFCGIINAGSAALLQLVSDLELRSLLAQEATFMVVSRRPCTGWCWARFWKDVAQQLPRQVMPPGSAIPRYVLSCSLPHPCLWTSSDWNLSSHRGERECQK